MDFIIVLVLVALIGSGLRLGWFALENRGRLPTWREFWGRS